MSLESGEDISPKILIITAPSGAGKTTIVNHLLNTNTQLAFSISACTRQKRENEVDGKHYYFISPEEFQNKVADNQFLEWEEVYDGIRYGTLRSEVDRLSSEGKVVVFDIDVKGALNLKNQFGPNALALFIKPPDLNTLIQRLTGRQTEDHAQLQKRVQRMKYELTFENRFDKVLVNKDLGVALLEATHLVNDFLKY